MYLPILDEALSLVTKWKFLFEEQDALFFCYLSYFLWNARNMYLTYTFTLNHFDLHFKKYNKS